MRQQGIKGFPTIPRNLTPSNACMLGKHSKRAFYSSSSRKLGLIHSYLCGPMHVENSNGNKYMLKFIGDY